MLIDIHTHKQETEEFSIYNANLEKTNAICSYGIHPWYHEFFTTSNKLLLEQLVQDENCMAIGECGLDKLAETDWETQVNYFEFHIQLSEKYQKPLLIHCVKAIQELILLKRKHQPKQAWIFHGFRKTNTLNQLLSEGFYISIGAAVLKDERLQEAVISIPIERLFLETDGLNFSISDIYQKVAELKKVEKLALKTQIKKNLNGLRQK